MGLQAQEEQTIVRKLGKVEQPGAAHERKKREHKKHQLDQKCSRIIFCVPGLFFHSGWPRGWLGRGLEGQSVNLRWQLGFNRSFFLFSCLCLCPCLCLCLCLSSLFIVFVIVNVSVFVSFLLTLSLWVFLYLSLFCFLFPHPCHCIVIDWMYQPCW